MEYMTDAQQFGGMVAFAAFVLITSMMLWSAGK